MMDRLLNNNVALRVIALVLACILWLAVHAEQGGSQQATAGVTESFELPVRVEVSADEVLVSQVPTVTARVTTNLLRLPTLASDMMKAEIVANAQDLGPGTYTVHVAAVNMPASVRSYTISPATVTVTLEPRVTVERPIRLSVVGTPSQGYVLGKPQLGAGVVDISGAASSVQSVAEVAGVVDASGLSQTETRLVDLLPLDASGKAVPGVTVTPSSIAVTLPVTSASQTVKLTPAVTGSPAAGYAVASVRLSPGSAVEQGLPASQLPSEGLRVPIDVTGLAKSTTVSVPVPLLPGMTGVSPTAVTAVIDVEPSAVYTIPDVPVTISGATGVRLLSPRSVSVAVTGAQSAVRAVEKDPSAVQAFVDATGMSRGTASLPIQIHLPAGVSAVSVSARTASVEAVP
ncbi:YbbR-like domain-containing protein [Alicyclobacillus fructus]|uniref:CdaR family protein n=1 Tax=Alicyclobacillus fructus TaxID=2816082 RepID=UPI001A9066F5|nr:CdaR family protein [Alicyclobacillus fructus]